MLADWLWRGWLEYTNHCRTSFGMDLTSSFSWRQLPWWRPHLPLHRSLYLSSTTTPSGQLCYYMSARTLFGQHCRFLLSRKGRENKLERWKPTVRESSWQDRVSQDKKDWLKGTWTKVMISSVMAWMGRLLKRYWKGRKKYLARKRLNFLSVYKRSLQSMDRSS